MLLYAPACVGVRRALLCYILRAGWAQSFAPERHLFFLTNAPGLIPARTKKRDPPGVFFPWIWIIRKVENNIQKIDQNFIYISFYTARRQLSSYLHAYIHVGGSTCKLGYII